MASWNIRGNGHQLDECGDGAACVLNEACPTGGNYSSAVCCVQWGGVVLPSLWPFYLVDVTNGEAVA